MIGAGSLGSLIVSIGADLGNLNKGLSAASTRINKFGKTASRSLNALGKQMIIFGGVMTAGFGATVKAAADFEEGITNVMTLITDDVEKVEKTFSVGVDRIARTFGESTNMLTKALFDIQSATGDTTKSIGILDEASALAVGGNSDLKASTEGLLTLLESYGDELNGAADAADLLFKAQEKARATVGELAVASGRFLPLAKLLSVDVEELYAVFAQLTVAMGNANEASTALVGILNGFIKPTEELKTLVKEWGFSTSQAALEELGLLGVLKKLEKVEKSRLGTLFPRIEGLKGLGAVIQNLSKTEENLIDIRNREGAVDEAVSKQMKTLNRQAKILGQELLSFARFVGNVLIPKVTNFGAKLLTLVRRVRLWADNNKELFATIVTTIAKIGLWSLALGALSIVLGKLIGVVAFFATGTIKAFVGITKVVLWAVKGIGATLIWLITTPIGLAISAVAIFATAWINNWGNIQKKVKWAAERIGSFIEGIEFGLLRMKMVLQKFVEADMADKLAHPIKVWKEAIKEVNLEIEKIKANEDRKPLGEKFGDGIQVAIDKTEEFKEKIAGLKAKLPSFKMEMPDLSMEGIADLIGLPELPEDTSTDLKKQALIEIASAEAEADAERIANAQMYSDLIIDLEATGIEVRKQQLSDFTLSEQLLQIEDLQTRMDKIILQGNLEKEQAQKLEDFKIALKKKTEKLETKIQKTKLAREKKGFDEGVNMLHSALSRMAGENKTAAIALKAVEIGQALMHTFRAATQVLPNIPLSAFITAMGLANVASIAATSFATGSDYVPEFGGFTHPGEIVVPRTFADSIRQGRLSLAGPSEGAAGKNINVYNNFEFENIHITDERDIEELAEALGDNIDSKLREA